MQKSIKIFFYIVNFAAIEIWCHFFLLKIKVFWSLQKANLARLHQKVQAHQNYTIATEAFHWSLCINDLICFGPQLY
jgi:hypothetical protein